MIFSTWSLAVVTCVRKCPRVARCPHKKSSGLTTRFTLLIIQLCQLLKLCTMFSNNLFYYVNISL